MEIVYHFERDWKFEKIPEIRFFPDSMKDKRPAPAMAGGFHPNPPNLIHVYRWPGTPRTFPWAKGTMALSTLSRYHD